MRIERDIINQFKVWKEASDRKPILLRGARQIGKTWAMETFGEECFKYCVKFDFDKQQELKSVFQISKDPERLVKELTLYCDQPIIAGETLMIFDEIQECEEALNCLKYFRDEAPQYHIIACRFFIRCSRQEAQDDGTCWKGENHQYVSHHFQGVPSCKRHAYL